jgi:hypothetical protein
MILLTSFFDAHDEARDSELAVCVRQNLRQCPAFGEAHYFLEGANVDGDWLPITLMLRSEVDRGVFVPERMTYRAYLEYANITFPAGTAVCLANADVWFDQTLLLVNAQNLGPKDFFACSRWGFMAHPTPDPVKGQWWWDEGYDLNAVISQDAWIFRTPVTIPEGKLDFQMGCMRCDNVLAKVMQDAGYRVTNPTLPGPKSLKVHHEHRSQKHNYGTPVPGNMLLVPPVQLG